MKPSAKIYVIQSRWIGGDDWTNTLHTGRSLEEATAALLADENQAAMEDNPEHQPYESIEDLIKAGDGEFLALLEEHEVAV